MRFSNAAIALAASILSANAQINGFNSGSTFADGSAKSQSDFEAEFRAMQNLPGATCFNSVRLFTSIQGATANTPISAIPAAIATQTTILLGLWASSGDSIIQNEIQAIQAAIKQYGSSFTDLVVGISVGSEDLYRDSSIAAQQKNTLPGASPSTLVNYIKEVRSALSSTALSGAKIGHVDTWTSWVNGTVSPVIEAVDWLGMDAYPYFENTLPDNSIGNSNSTFYTALGNTQGASNGKPVWVTETGWPTQGDVSGKAVASVDNAETYWKDTGCSLFGNINTWWYILRDAGSPDPLFGIEPSDLSAPLFDLTCPSGSSGAKACGSGNNSSSSASSGGASSSGAASSSAAVSSVASASAPTTTAATSTADVIATPGSATAVPSGPSSSAAGSAAPYPTGSSSGASMAGTAPVGTGGVASSSGSVVASGTSSASPSSYTGAASKAAGAIGAGVVAVAAFVAAL